MPNFNIYEMFDAISLEKFVSDTDNSIISQNKECEKQTLNILKGRMLLQTFIYMSNKTKMNLLTHMFLVVRKLSTLANILNIFSSVNTKLISYSKICTDSNSLYDQFVQDDDRMLDLDVLEESLKDVKEWFIILDDSDQMKIIISLMRLSGGRIIKNMYVRLIKIYNKKNLEGKQELTEYKSFTSMLFLDSNEKLVKISDFQPICEHNDESDYNYDCPSNKRVVEARKQWQTDVLKLKKEIELNVKRLNDPIFQKNNFKAGTKHEKDGLEMKGMKTNEIKEIDWVQFLPVWNVKKIFTYLDDKNLRNLKNVNGYWAAVSREILAERKTREYLNSVISKSKDIFENVLDIPQIVLELQIEEDLELESPGYRKRKEKQRRTATSIRRKKEIFEGLHDESVLRRCFEEFDTQNISLPKLKTFPTKLDVQTRVEKSTPTISEVTIVNAGKNEFVTKAKLSEKDTESTSSSIANRVPSITVSFQDMQTW